MYVCHRARSDNDVSCPTPNRGVLLGVRNAGPTFTVTNANANDLAMTATQGVEACVNDTHRSVICSTIGAGAAQTVGVGATGAGAAYAAGAGRVSSSTVCSTKCSELRSCGIDWITLTISFVRSSTECCWKRKIATTAVNGTCGIGTSERHKCSVLGHRCGCHKFDSVRWCCVYGRSPPCIRPQDQAPRDPRLEWAPPPPNCVLADAARGDSPTTL